jgi:hypothetical protein
MGYAILKGEGSIQEKIRELFTSRTRSHRRVILGPAAALAPANLPDTQNVEIYSWGQESLVDTAPLASLAARGVRINWVNPMHLRLYWVKGKGAVIGPGLGGGNVLTGFDRQQRGDMALYLDAGALMAVDEVLGPLLLDPAGSDTFCDLQESCHLLWRLAEGITATEPPRPRRRMRVSAPAATADRKPSVQAADSLASLENRQKAQARESWYSFLVEEASEPEGLLCYFDRPRTVRVERCRSFFSCFCS